MALGIGDVFALSAVALGANVEALFAKDKHRTGKGFSAGLNLLHGAVGCALGGNVDKNDGQCGGAHSMSQRGVYGKERDNAG